MTLMKPTVYARARGLPTQTLFNAINDGVILLNEDHMLNVEEVDAGWYADHLVRAEQLKATEASRVKRRDAAAVAAASSIRTLRRQLAELQRTTATRSAAEAAHARRLARLQAALEGFPARYTAEAATALQRPPAAVRAVLDTFTARLINELAMKDPSDAGQG